MKYLISHKTTYTYFEPVSLCHNIARLVPRDTDWQYCRNVVVTIDPEPHTINKYEYFFGNHIIYFSIEQEHAQLTVHVRSEIEPIERGISKKAVQPALGAEACRDQAVYRCYAHDDLG